MDEVKLIEKARKGDRKAMEALYNKHVDRIYRFLYSRVESKEDAEDLTAQTFLSVVEGIEDFESRSSFAHWVFSIARHKLNDFLRRKYMLHQVELNAYTTPFEEEITSETSDELLRAVWSIVKKLPERYRKVLTLRFKEQLSVEEVARRLGVSETNVKVIQHRAIKKAANIALKLNK